MATRRWLLALALGAAPAVSALADPPAPTVLHLTQSAERRLTRDLLYADLRAEKTGADPQVVEATINQSMAKALAQARQVPGVEIETGSYGVSRESQILAAPQWTGSQSLRLTATDSGALLKLAGALQAAGLVMSNLANEASPKTVRDAEDALTEEALSGLEHRAATIARQLHLSVQGYRDLTVGNAQTGGGPMRVAMTGSGSPAPVAAPGEATVRLTVSADVLLTKSP